MSLNIQSRAKAPEQLSLNIQSRASAIEQLSLNIHIRASAIEKLSLNIHIRANAIEQLSLNIYNIQCMYIRERCTSAANPQEAIPYTRAHGRLSTGFGHLGG